MGELTHLILSVQIVLLSATIDKIPAEPTIISPSPVMWQVSVSQNSPLLPQTKPNNAIDQIPYDLRRILMCESGMMHYRNGMVITSRTNDVGIMQINTTAHLARAQSLGYNLWKFEDNIAYGLLLYKEKGLQPWVCSRM